MLIYSASGGILSFIIILLKKFLGNHLSILGVSAAGAVFHNIGELLAAALILENFGVILYLPFLSLAGIVTGIFVGLTANYILNHLNKIPNLKKNLFIYK